MEVFITTPCHFKSLTTVTKISILDGAGGRSYQEDLYILTWKSQGFTSNTFCFLKKVETSLKDTHMEKAHPNKSPDTFGWLVHQINFLYEVLQNKLFFS